MNENPRTAKHAGAFVQVFAAIGIALLLVLMQAAVGLADNAADASFGKTSAAEKTVSTAGNEDSDVDVALDLDGVYLTYAKQVVTQNASTLSVPEKEKLQFNVSAAVGYELSEVSIVTGGKSVELAPDASGSYTVDAQYVQAGLVIKAQAEKIATQTSEEVATPIEDAGTESAFTDKASAEAAKGTRTVYTYEDSSVTVTATLADATAVPDAAEFKVTPVKADTDGYNYEAYMTALNGGDSSDARYTDQNTLLYDIAFLYEGWEYEPAAGSVAIEMKFKQDQLSATLGATAQTEGEVEVNHLALGDELVRSAGTTAKATGISASDVSVESAEGVSADADGETVSFSSEDFSVFSISQTGVTMAWSGSNPITAEGIVQGLGKAADYAVFAENFTNTDHVEGNIAVDNYYTNGATQLNALGNIYTYNMLKSFTIEKTVTNGTDGTFSFGVFDKSGTLLTQTSITTSGGSGSAVIDVQGDSTLQNAARSGSLFVYELDAQGNRISQGETAGDYTVTYTSANGSVSNEVPGNYVAATTLASYLGKVYLTDGSVNDSSSLADIQSHVLDGTNNVAYATTSNPFGGPMELGEAFDDAFGGQNGDQLIVHVENGTWSVLRDSGFTAPSQYVTYTAEQNRVALEMERLASFSTQLAGASSSASGNDNGDGSKTYVINVSGEAGAAQVWWPVQGTTHQLSSSLSAAGYTHVNDGSGFLSSFKSSGDYLVVNVDCTGLSSYDIDNLIVDGTQTNGTFDNYLANHMIINLVQREGGAFVPFSGLVQLTGNTSGIIFAPAATIKYGNVASGQAIAKTVIRGGSEIHKVGITDQDSEHTATVAVANASDWVSSTGSLVVKKTFAGDAADLSDEQKAAISFTVSGPDGYSMSFTYADMTQGSLTLEGLAVGEYTVVEANAQAGGYSVETSYSVEGGKVAIGAGQSATVEVTNTYTRQKTTAKIEARKTLSGRTLEAREFTFKLEGVQGTSTEGYSASATNDAQGAVSFKEIEYGQIGQYRYTLSEVAGDETGVQYDARSYTVTVDVSVDQDTGGLRADVDYGAAEAVFENDYRPEGTTARIGGTKALENHDLSEGEFTFGLYESTADFVTTGKLIDEATNDAQGAFSFDEISYADQGTYYYVVKETEGSAGGIVYDKTVKKVQVVVKDQDGKLEAQVTSDEPISFTNSYRAEGNIVFTGTKTLEGQQITAENAALFSYEILDVDDGNAVVGHGTTGAAGSIAFDRIDYALSDVGEHHYIVREIIPEGAVQAQNGKWRNGAYLYDGTNYYVTVKVSDAGGDGTLAAEITSEDKSFDFANAYEASGQVVFSAAKELRGAALQADQFSFRLLDGDGAELQTAANAANGAVTFQPITYSMEDLANADGSYASSRQFSYVIEEAGAGTTQGGIAYDDKRLPVTVTVVDTGAGALEATCAYGAADALFVNTYEAQGSATFEGSKTLTGRAMTSDDEFSFTVTEVDAEGAVLQDAEGGAIEYVVAADTATGAIDYPLFQYGLEDVGTHYYTVRENAPAGSLASGEGVSVLRGVSYDTSAVRNVRVEVSDNGDGTLSTEVSVDGVEGGTADFVNAYDASGSIAFAGDKTLLGRDMTDADVFNFSVTENGQVVATGQNAADGTIAFTPIDYTLQDAGTHTYSVSEDASTVAGVSSDEQIYTVTVDVADNGDGTLAISASDNAQALAFANTYFASGSASVQVTKSINEWGSASSFDFALTSTDGAPLPDGATGQTALAQATQTDPVASFGQIAYRLPGTYRYTINEVVPDAAQGNVLDGITYDPETYEVVVTVGEPEADGTLPTQVSYAGAESLVITNTYRTSATTATLEATKALQGRDWREDDVFQFVMEAQGGAPTPADNNRTASATAAAPTARFDAIAFDQPGTYDYFIREVVPASAERNDDGTYTLNGVTYDASEHTATVEVVDNGDGTLSASVSYDTGSVPVFTNVYSAASAQATLAVGKIVQGGVWREGDTFTFDLAAEAGAPLPQTTQVTLDKQNQTREFGQIDYDATGTYVYDIAEQVPLGAIDGVFDGIRYDSSVHQAVVTVVDDGSGALSATVSYDGEEEATAAAATNVYVETASNQVFLKQYFGDRIGAQFGFTLTATDADYNPRSGTSVSFEDGEEVFDDGSQAFTISVANGAFDGTEAQIVFPEIRYRTAGDYYYRVSEDDLSDESVQGDTAVYRLHVTVSADADGILSAATDYAIEYNGSVWDVPDPSGLVFFNNDTVSMGFASMSLSAMSMAAAQVQVDPKVEKQLSGGTLREGEFTFQMVDDATGNVIDETTNASDGTVAFDLLDFAQPGTYTYTIREVAGDEGTIIYDASTVAYTVKVTQSADGSLQAEQIFQQNGEITASPTFVNTVNGIDLAVRKTSRDGGEGLSGATYALYRASSTGQDVLLGEEDSDEEGYIYFRDVPIEEGVYYYFKEVEAPQGHTVDPYRSAYFTVVKDAVGTYSLSYEDRASFDARVSDAE